MKLSDEQLNDMAAEYANEKHPNPFFSEMRNISAQDYKAGFRAAEQAQQWVPLPAPQLPEGRYDLWDKEIGSRLVNIGLDRRDLENGIFGISHVMPVPSPPQTPNT